MERDRLRQVATIGTFLVTLALNGAANALPLNGQTTGVISDRFPVLVVPAGYVFSIWGLIYLLQAVFVVWQARPSLRRDPLLRRLGLVPAAAAMLNALWIVTWHYEVFAASVVVMIALLVSLVTIHLRVRAGTGALAGAPRWTVALPFSVYLGWITVATIANVAAVLAWAGFSGLGLDPALWAAAVLAVGAAIATTFVRRFGDVAYALVIAWAYVGVAVKESGVPLVAGVALAGAVVVTLVAAAGLAARRADIETSTSAVPAA